MLKPPSHSTENPELFQQRYSELGTLLFLGVGLILTAVLIVLISGTLRSIHSSLPSTSLLLSRDIHIMANHLGRTRDALVSVRATPSMTMLHGLEVATKRLNMAFFRDDDHRLAGVSPDLARLAGTIPPTIASLHEMVAKGPPVSTGMLEHALATVEAVKQALDRQHLALDSRVDAVIATQNIEIGHLEDYIPVALTSLCAFALISAFLFHLRRAALKRLNHIAWYDSLTGIPNRAFFLHHCDALMKSGGERECFALVLIDLDRFKEVNDAFGHQIGDRLLQEVASYFESETRASDFVARQGGDEFVLIIRSPKDENDVIDYVNRLARPLHGYINLSRFNVPVSCSMGMALFPRDADTIDELMRNADLALYAAKDSGNGARIMFTPDLLDRYATRLDLEHRLRQALMRNEFFVAWQPQFDLRTGTVRSLEALVRWDCPHERRIIMPGEFLPIAEQSGLISKIDLRVLELACQQAEAWRHSAVGPIRIAVNLSGRHFKSTAIVRRILRTLAATGLPADLLEVEITENVFIENHAVATDVVRALRENGIGVALDDFGTGYSNLSNLAGLGLTSLKIDRSFVYDLAHDARKRSLLHIIIALGRAFDLTVVAEGVEGWSEFEFFLNSDCDVLQGYLISPPMTALEFEDWYAAADNLFTDFKIGALQEMVSKGLRVPKALPEPGRRLSANG